MAKFNWLATPINGIRFREHDERKHGVKRDRFFQLRYMSEGKRFEESLGWASQGWTLEKAMARLSEIKENIRLGQGPQSMKEKRDLLKTERKAEVAKQVALDKENYIFGELAPRFMEWAKSNKRSWKTDSYRLNKHLLPHFGAMPLRDIRRADIEEMKTRALEQCQSPASVGQLLALVRVMFNFAVNNDLYAGLNPVRGVKFPKLNNQRVRFLSYSEVDTLLEAARERSQYLHDACAISTYAGLRRQEIANLLWKDIDMQSGVIHIRDAKAGDRQAYINDELASVLQSRMSLGLGDKVFECSAWSMTTNFKILVDSLGWNENIQDNRHKVCFHSLRHTFCSWLAMQGETLLTIKELAGHKTIQMTMRYSHLMPDQKRAAIQKMGRHAAGKVVPFRRAGNE